MLKFIFDFITAPLSLPFNPLANYVLCILIGEVAFQVAFYWAGMIGKTSGDRRILHWFFRALIYLSVWTVVYILTVTGRFIENNWRWLVPLVIGTGGTMLIGLCCYKKTKVKNKNMSPKND